MIAKRLCLLVLVVWVLFHFSGCMFIMSEPLKTLADQGKHEDLKNKALKEDEARFDKVRRALINLEIIPGLSKKEFTEEYGEPVVVVPETFGESWLYHARGKSFFSAPKVYLYFNKEDKVTHWDCIHTECESLDKTQ